jgi:hypothetical protein
MFYEYIFSNNTKEITSFDSKRLNVKTNHETNHFYLNDTCVFPKLSIVSNVKIDPNSNKKCPISDWGYIDKKHIWHMTAPNSIKNIKCEYTPIVRIDDFKVSVKSNQKLEDGTQILDDVFEVNCIGELGEKKLKYNTVFAQIINLLNNDKIEIKNDNQQCEPMSIILLSYDSVSSVQWKHQLKKTTDYFLNVMHSTVLEGYNIVGDGTPAALIPIYAGSTEEELPSALKNNPKGLYVDEAYPFIWKELQNEKNKYMSIYLDDTPSIGAFTYRMRGFKKHTTDHYFKHYALK